MEPADRTFFLREKQEPQSLKPVSYTHLSFLAQGGICMLRGEDDYEDYFEDTMRAGHYENNKKAVDLMLRSSNSIIDVYKRQPYRGDFCKSLSAFAYVISVSIQKCKAQGF